MTEAEARRSIAARYGSARHARVERYVDLLIAETERQSLIAASTVNSVWARHIVDSAQLIDLAPAPGLGPWIDIGSGAGLPGMVVAMLTDWPVIMIEPRRLRAEFLATCIDVLGLTHARILQSKAATATIESCAAVISARAVTSLSALLAETRHLADAESVWILPKGRSAESEVVTARESWHGMFHVERSMVDEASGIVIARGVSKR